MKLKIGLVIWLSIMSGLVSAREWEGNNGGRWGGCVVEGTQITLQNGQTKSIEKILESDRILTNTGEFFGPLLRIRGPENIPLYRIRTNKGKSVVATEGHPFIGIDKRIYISKELKVGNSLQTIDGPEIITEINLVESGKMVYNLILASDDSLSEMYRDKSEAKKNGFNTVEYQRRLDPFLGLNSSQHSFFINGIASGDLVIQQAIKN